MLRGSALIFGAAAASGIAGWPAGPAAARPWKHRSTFVPGADWYDTWGNLIEAHTGGMYVENGTYYWVGANWQGKYGFQKFNLYSSTDLARWEFVSTVLEPSSDLPTNHEVARPKILYNGLTDSYVMWFKRKDYAASFNDVRPGVATSKTLDGPFEFLTDFYPGADPQYNAADFCLWQEPDGTAYYIASSPNVRGGEYDRRIIMFRLTPDYRGLEPEPVYVGPSDGREAPAVFERLGTYYLVTSGTSGWTANQSAYRTAPSLLGPWSDLEDLGDVTTYDSQPDFILPVHGKAKTTYLYAGGRHLQEALGDSRYVWLPLTFSGDRLTLDYYDSWSLDPRTGVWHSGRDGS
ncbi:hypothetical protein GCM10025865_14940 [Paraoerskovia sediminicola]|uniref:Glycosyl hydrolases family 43 n=2 Tax=Paraoerskovia sediminicola TaxID=1138587 RepID=A0ABN6XEI6_9CELL|nr:hypothetical protein GCM10025865_14940 [Paraoerskovia sediminicola]